MAKARSRARRRTARGDVVSLGTQVKPAKPGSGTTTSTPGETGQPTDDGEKATVDRAQSMLWRALAVEALSANRAGSVSPRRRGPASARRDEGTDV